MWCILNRTTTNRKSGIVQLTVLIFGLICLLAVIDPPPGNPPLMAATNDLSLFTNAWRDHPVWYDDRAEFCLYESTRSVYGVTRRYQTKIYTNKEWADPHTKTKNTRPVGREVFKHHSVELISTENYDYKFSTMSYVGTEDLKSLKIDMGSQDDCGSSFKQFVNHAGTLIWHSFVYFPGAGHKHGAYAPPVRFVFQDSLSLILRGYPFDSAQDVLEINLLLDQTSHRETPAEPVPARIVYLGREVLQLPIGEVATHHLRVTTTRADEIDTPTHDYWFAASGEPPWLHVMVQYKGPGSLTDRLREHRRWAYWKQSSTSQP